MANRKNDYPEWVLKYKEKGKYINFVKPDKYYLYAAHSERIKGTDKVKRVCDGYIGRITQKDGLIKSKKNRPTADNNVYLLEFGISHLIMCCTAKIRLGMSRSYKDYGDWVYAMSILAYMHQGFWSDDFLSSSYLSVQLKDMKKPEKVPRSLEAGIERGVRMINDTLTKTYGDSLAELLAYASTVGIIRKNNRYSLTYVTPYAKSLFEKHHISMEVDIDAEN